jgi:hypothetical protein
MMAGMDFKPLKQTPASLSLASGGGYFQEETFESLRRSNQLAKTKRVGTEHLEAQAED